MSNNGETNSILDSAAARREVFLAELRKSLERAATAGEQGPKGPVAALSTTHNRPRRRGRPPRHCQPSGPISKTEPVAIELLARSDLASATTLLKKCVAERRMSPLVLEDDLAERHGRPDVAMLKAAGQSCPGQTNSSLDAFIDATFGQSWTFVERLATAPEFRGRGLGSALLDSIVELSRCRGIQTIRLLVLASNLESRLFYAHRGFVEVSSASKDDYHFKMLMKTL
jgi:GNAT superfamily N-acetyltransferase